MLGENWAPLQEKEAEELEFLEEESQHTAENEDHRRRLSPSSSDCACWYIEILYITQAWGTLVQEWVTGEDWLDLAVQDLAQERGWETLYGPDGRREQLEEELPDPPERRGAPRTCFVPGRTIMRAARFVDHAREAGPEHVRRSLSRHTVPEMSEGSARWRALPETTGYEMILELSETASGLTDPRYDYRRRRMTNRVVAAVAGCDVRTVRNLRVQNEDPIHEQESVLGWVENLAVHVEEARGRTAEDRRRDKVKREAMVLFLGNSVEEMKEWLCDQLDVTRGELVRDFIRRRYGSEVDESTAVNRFVKDEILPRL